MIEEQFVSFDTAKMLKEAGFEEMVNSCFMYDDKAHEYEYEFVNGYAIVKKALRDNYNGYENTISRPTQALAAMWLREVHHLNVYACFDYVCFDDGERKWFFMRENTMINDYTSVYCSIISYDSYEQALEAGLQEAVKLIKK